MKSHTALLLIAKQPVPGRVKTRLSPPLSSTQAAELYRCFLEDILDQLRGIPETDLFIVYDPPEARGFFSARHPEEFLLEQPGGDLGERLTCAFSTVLSSGYPAAVALGCDAPALPTMFIEQAVALLRRDGAPLVVGPSEDGGYYLIGMTQYHDQLFRDIPWSTAEVYGETCRQAQQAGISPATLPLWYDVDDRVSLDRMRHDLKPPHHPDITIPRRTAAYLQTLNY